MCFNLLYRFLIYVFVIFSEVKKRITWVGSRILEDILSLDLICSFAPDFVKSA